MNPEFLEKFNGQNFNPSASSRELFTNIKNPEKELSLIIAKYHADTAAIRRHMIEYEILDRDAQSVYYISLKVLPPSIDL